MLDQIGFLQGRERAAYQDVSIQKRYLAGGDLAQLAGDAVIDFITECKIAQNAILGAVAHVDRLD